MLAYTSRHDKSRCTGRSTVMIACTVYRTYGDPFNSFPTYRGDRLDGASFRFTHIFLKYISWKT